MAERTNKPPRTLVIASNNQHKLQEIRAILGGKWLVLSAHDVVPSITWDESGQTFIENARIKVQALRRHTSHCILADDSGLCVDALGGRPGVWSSSFGGREGDHAANNARLLKELEGIPVGKRQAHFICVLVFEDEHGRESIYEGMCPGEIATGMDGTGGFGYDPLFFLPDRGVMMAHLTEIEKNKISHRGRAMTKFLSAQSISH